MEESGYMKKRLSSHMFPFSIHVISFIFFLVCSNNEISLVKNIHFILKRRVFGLHLVPTENNAIPRKMLF